MDELASLLGRHGFLPHGYCFAWSPGVLWSMVGADTFIALAYFSIPVTIFRFVRLRAGDVDHRVAWFFCAFIFTCGLTHVMDIWTLWRPDYALATLLKVITAAVSVATAVFIWRRLPQALSIPAVSALQAANRSLLAEMSQRKTAQENLADIEQSLSVTLASIDAGFIATDAKGCVTGMNAVAERLTGWTQAQARGHILWQVFLREGRPADLLSRSPVDVMSELGVSIEQSHRVIGISRDGTKTPLEVKAAIKHAEDGSVRGTVMVLRDLTRTHRAEDTRQRLVAIVESSNDAIIGKTLDGRITDWNRAAQTMFGYSESEAIGQPIQMLFPAERISEEMRILADLASGRAVPVFETVRKTKQGKLLEVSVTISPIRDAEGRVMGASKIVRDVSQQKDMQVAQLKAHRLEAENRQIQEANRLKSQFLANMSHELRTPLNAIIGFSDLMRSGAVAADSPKHKDFLGHINVSGRHLLQLINDVLDLSKVEAGKFEFFPEPVDLPRLVKEVCDVQTAALQNKRLTLEIDIHPEVADLVLDGGRLKQALYNYLSNAIKFTPQDGHVTVRAQPEGARHVRIEVQDSGIGIHAADLARLFVEFQQLDASYGKQHQGTGLGLALTRKLVQAQGGSVGVRSTVGVGSVFHLVLLKDMTGVEPGALDQQGVAHALPQRLLLVENHGDTLSAMATALTRAGFAVDTAVNTQQAIDQAGVTAYAAISLDLKMVDSEGQLALLGIRRDGASRGAPVLSLTLAGPPTDTVGTGPAAAFPVADVLSKPIRSDEVIRALERSGVTGQTGALIMVIDDDPVALDLMRTTLEGLGLACVCMLDARQALLELDQHRPQALILDLMMPGLDGFGVLDELSRMPKWHHLPVFIWTCMILTEKEQMMLAHSAQAILSKGGGALQTVLDRLRYWRPRDVLPEPKDLV